MTEHDRDSNTSLVRRLNKSEAYVRIHAIFKEQSSEIAPNESHAFTHPKGASHAYEN